MTHPARTIHTRKGDVAVFVLMASLTAMSLWGLWAAIQPFRF